MRRWMMLALGTAAQTVACTFLYGLPYTSDVLRRNNGLTLGQVGLLIACPTVGLVLTLVAWGALADRFGERGVITSGLAMTTVLLSLGGAVNGLVPLGVLLALAGAASASVSAASGRLVVGWFSAQERGLAMGIRQTSTPLGMGIAALIVPTLAARSGVKGTVLFCAALCGVVAVLVGSLTSDPPRTAQSAAQEPAANPYRHSSLWRIHASSALLCVPQFAANAFAMVFLIDVRGWSAVHAGQLLVVSQVLGAVSRVVAGRWSDRVGSRVRPMRQLSVCIAVVMGATALGALWPSPLTDLAMIVACGVTASTNGLAFTATAELAGRSWSGRAMGVQNTGQNLAASLTPPLLGGLIGSAGYAWGFMLAGVLAGAACFMIPTLGSRALPGSHQEGAIEPDGLVQGARHKGKEKRSDADLVQGG
ncbi:MFS transporter [Streptomyces sp. NPDC057291]|uniref:MFS transporter n=1 Tax=Streptomyces sp. NPDC057291 TaxID=3346087 RepID=UPI00363867A5